MVWDGQRVRINVGYKLLFAVKAPAFHGPKRELVQVTASAYLQRHDVVESRVAFSFGEGPSAPIMRDSQLGPSVITSRHDAFEVDTVPSEILVMCIER